jgi:Transposase IS66 family
VSKDTFYVGNMKGVGRIYQQTFIDTYAKVALAKLYDRKTPISGKAEIAEELRYGLNHWDGLTRFLDDGRIELDTNNVERGIR